VGDLSVPWSKSEPTNNDDDPVSEEKLNSTLAGVVPEFVRVKDVPALSAETVKGLVG